ncbi:MAG: quinolinate synthase NadA, partial [Calditrichaeota bacterium]|nr:quinolinate synthase NadA [Calditrichota bacterium]
AMVREAETIVFCGVHFMAETAKVVNPQRRVLLPNLRAGCSLADTAEETRLYERIEELRRDLGDLAVVCYINTTAAVKALCDACCTSANAVAVVRALPQQNVLFLPDRNLARHVANQLPEKNVIAWEGYCYVHQEIDPETIAGIRQTYPDLKVLAHPECRDDVVRLADAALSTSGMVEYARKSPDRQFLAVTECGLSDLLAIEVPDKQFLRACRICRFMKMITLDDIIRSLECLQPEIALPAYVREGAGRSLRRMFELTTPDRMPEALYGVSLN